MSRCMHNHYLRRSDSSTSLSSTTTTTITTATCSMCAATWAEMIENEQNRLALLQERFELDKAMFKADRKKYRQEQVILSQRQSTEVQRLKLELVSLSAQLAEEIRTTKTLEWEWKLKYQSQGRELDETKRTMRSKLQALQTENNSLMSEMEKQAQLSMGLAAKMACQATNARIQQEKMEELRCENESLKMAASRKMRGEATVISQSSDSNNIHHDEMEDLCHDLEDHKHMLKVLQEQTEILQMEKEANLMEIQQLQKRCQEALETAAIAKAASTTCTNCVDLETEIHELTRKFNERPVEYHGEVDKDQNRIERILQPNVDQVPSTMELPHGSPSSPKTAEEIQGAQKMEMVQQRFVAKCIALEARQELTEREKAAVEVQLKESRADMHRLRLELEQLKKEMEIAKQKGKIEGSQQLLQFDFEEEPQKKQTAHASQQQKDLQEWENILFSIGDQYIAMDSKSSVMEI